MTTQFFSHNGNQVAYTREGVGRAILFLHNGGAAKEIWTEQVRVLRDKHEVICLDHLGFGESDMPETGYTLDKYVDLLSAFIDHLGTERVSVVANCMGSAMSLLLADRRPDIFDALVLLNPLSEHTAREGVIGWVMPAAAKFPRLSNAVARRIRVPAPVTKYVIAAQYGPRGWRRGLRSPLPGAVAAGAGWSRRGRLTSMAELFSDLTLLRAVDELRPGADFPALAVVWGAANLGLSPRAGRDLNRTLNPDREEFLPRCGHLPMMENPEAVTAIIDEFIGNPPNRRIHHDQLVRA
ncbi:alpha/beta fold hydrolase [Antrihabitans stalactiti]|uniref:Alpha/beta hydrolase n=1 Tax=Antrihabitans stalactiti TaxID=2584121 RepID=A0A848K9P6_9NOCA|nr:alpha/beta hydrolase [Antrihabitans stalactiti]NMN95523.1 alpha/beta hydrolase [Antrihabitans stalactiti]